MRKRCISACRQNVRSEGNWTPLHFAPRFGHAGVVNEPLGNGADVNARDKSGKIPLHVVDKVDQAWSKGEC
jgi:ankyrin repeat protein